MNKIKIIITQKMTIKNKMLDLVQLISSETKNLIYYWFCMYSLIPDNPGN